MSEVLSTALAVLVRESRSNGLPSDVSQATKLFLLNALGTCIAGSPRPVAERLVAAAVRLGETSTYRVPGRHESLSLGWSATVTGAAGHVDDFDDTHPVTYIHAGPTLVATCLALSQHVDVSGPCLLDAIALGYEVQFRAALAISPEQYVAGWHSTGVFGVLGAATAASILLDLDDEATAAAIDLAAQLILGHQEGLGTMNKSFHAGKAAANGLRIALAIHAGLRPAGGRNLESLLSAMAIGYQPRFAMVLDGHEWRLLDNRTKPFPCGVVAHPGVEAALSAAEEVRETLDSVRRIVVRCLPIATTLTGIAEPTTELNTRLSLPHAVAAALVTGRAGLPQFTRASISDPQIARLRGCVELVGEPTRSEFSAAITIERDGLPSVVRELAAVTGSPDHPMSYDAVADKFTHLVEPVLPHRSEPLRVAVGSLPETDSVRELQLLTLPVSEVTR